MKFPEYIDKFMSIRVSRREESYKDQVEMALRCHLIPYFQAFELHEIDYAEIEDFASVHLKQHKKLADKTGNNILGVLSPYLKFCFQRKRDTGMEHMPVMFWLPRRKQAADVEYLEPDELARLFKIVDQQPYQLMLVLAACTGLRIGELLALRWEDVDYKNKQLHVKRAIGKAKGGKAYVKLPKNNTTRQVPLADFILVALRNQLRLGDWIFMSHRTKKKLTHGAAYKALKKYNAKAGIKKNGWHLHRHTFATNAAAMNESLNDLRVMLGHAGWSEMKRYLHARSGQGRSTIDALAAHYDPSRFNLTRRTPQGKAS